MSATSMKKAAVMLGAAAVLLASPAIAQEAGRYKLPGVYDYATVKKSPDGRPACVERWTLGADGAFRLESGQEVLEGAWRKESDHTDTISLAMTGLKSNGQPDCRGARATGPVSDFWVEVAPNAEGQLVIGSWEHPGASQPWVRRPTAILAPALDPAGGAKP
jgi:hypothetical protein